MKSYPEAMHAMQTGVGLEIERVGLNDSGCSPKHLRVGINSNMITEKAIATLLIAKGIITREEYIAAITQAANEEAALYERRLSTLLGGEIKLL